MDRNIILGILSVTLIALAAAILLPGGRTVDSEPKLPWLINVESPEKVTVLGITLGQSTLAEVEGLLKEGAKANLFFSPEGDYAVEAYFQRVYLSGIRADLVLTMGVDNEIAKGMFDKGRRISKLGSGGKKVDLSTEDMAQLKEMPISHITYMPATNLEEDLIASRFGEPDERLKEKDSEITHWLYPEKGLDIAINPDGKEVLQYLLPANFDQITEPLRNP